MNKLKLALVAAITILFVGICITGCRPSVKSIENTDSLYTEQFRPQFHFSPAAHWMNDPNGLVFYKGEYHLFYQYYPDSNVWGPMHWGHAISNNLVNWKHMPAALFPDSLGYIFSGSAVADVKNTSGLGTPENPPLVAIFTYHDPVGEKKGSLTFQNEGLAYSKDAGRSWIKYAANPVLKNPGIRDFRDPKVIWHEESGKWVMILAVHDRIHLYSSPDLIHWSFLSEFGQGTGAHGGVWECPDLFRMKVKGTNDMKWVMLVSINPGGPNGGSATQYFVGNFDGTRFINESKEIGWVDWGRDNYAGVTWSNISASDGRRLFIGWMSNWQYANVVPTTVWRNAMTLPRELELMHTEEGYLLVSNPARELEILRTEKTQVYEELHGSEKVRDVFIDSINLGQCELIFDFEQSGPSVDSFGIILQNAVNEKLVIGYSVRHHELFVDRTSAGMSGFSGSFAGIAKAPYKADKKMQFHIFLDASSAELFVDHGCRVLTNLVFPTVRYNQLKVFSPGGSVIVKRAEFHNLNPAW
jgi:fructan beta-fructosidase